MRTLQLAAKLGLWAVGLCLHAAHQPRLLSAACCSSCWPPNATTGQPRDPAPLELPPVRAPKLLSLQVLPRLLKASRNNTFQHTCDPLWHLRILVTTIGNLWLPWSSLPSLIHSSTPWFLHFQFLSRTGSRRQAMISGQITELLVQGVHQEPWTYTDSAQELFKGD